VSLCIVAMNEADCIGRCIESVDFAAEVVVVDSHSTDGTREVAASLGARVIERDWAGFVAQKNYCVDQARHEWVLVLDADEWLSPEARTGIVAALGRAELPDGFELNRLNRYLGRWVRRSGWYPDRKLRLYRRSRGHFEGMSLHERVRVDGVVERIPHDILHDPYRSLSEHLRTIDRYTTIAAEEKWARGQRARIVDLVLRPAAKFLGMYLLKRGFLDGTTGFVMAVTGSFYVFLKYAKLWALPRRDSARP
jgi:glycosyltransferase involved in cell wall biosynthesis